MEGSGQLHAMAAVPPGKELPGTHWIGDWVGSSVGLDAVEMYGGVEVYFHHS
jgi:hypothetical protein